MYTEKELRFAAGIIKRIARKHHLPEKKIRSDIEEAMQAGRSNPDPAVQARWANFHYSGENPTIEEFILWAAATTALSRTHTVSQKATPQEQTTPPA